MVELAVQQVYRRFGGVLALGGVSMEVTKGERRAVIGPNGAGKSTLFRIISGELPPSRGHIYLGGQRTTGLPPERVASLGLSRTFQHSSLFPEASVLENVMLALLAHRRDRWHPWRPLSGFGEVRQAAGQLLEQVGLADKADWPAGFLAHGEQRQLELAMALMQRPRVLLLDEPLAGLAAAERAHLGQRLLDLPREITVLLIEHDLEFAYTFADRLTVLHHGEVLAEGRPAEIRANPAVQEVYVGKGEHQVAGPRGEVPATHPPRLQAQEVEAGYGAARVLDGVSLEVRRGEVVALLGRNGMGKTTLLHTLMGFLRPGRGRILLEGRDVTGLSALQRAQAGMALVPQGRRVFAELTVEEQLRLGSRPGPWTLERVYQLFPRLRERRGVLGSHLSGGEQQMLAIGRALLRNPQVLLMDEPSEGLSPLLVQQIRRAVVTLREEGETILLAEQNVDLALAVADRVYVLERGRVVFHGDPMALKERPELLQKTMSV